MELDISVIAQADLNGSETRRLALHEELCELLGSRNVYFQPPGNQHEVMQYPCFRYSLSKIKQTFANNKMYNYNRAYTIMYITTYPDTGMIDKVLKHFSMVVFDRTYVADQLNHYVFSIYY